MPQREYAKAYARNMEGRRYLPNGMAFNAAEAFTFMNMNVLRFASYINTNLIVATRLRHKAYARNMKGRRCMPNGMAFNAAIMTDMFDNPIFSTLLFALLGFAPVAVVAIYLRNKK